MTRFAIIRRVVVVVVVVVVVGMGVGAGRKDVCVCGGGGHGGVEPQQMRLGDHRKRRSVRFRGVGVLTRLDLFVSLQLQQNLIMGGGKVGSNPSATL